MDSVDGCVLVSLSREDDETAYHIIALTLPNGAALLTPRYVHDDPWCSGALVTTTYNIMKLHVDTAGLNIMPILACREKQIPYDLYTHSI